MGLPRLGDGMSSPALPMVPGEALFPKRGRESDQSWHDRKHGDHGLACLRSFVAFSRRHVRQPAGACVFTAHCCVCGEVFVAGGCGGGICVCTTPKIVVTGCFEVTWEKVGRLVRIRWLPSFHYNCIPPSSPAQLVVTADESVVTADGVAALHVPSFVAGLWRLPCCLLL